MPESAQNYSFLFYVSDILKTSECIKLCFETELRKSTNARGGPWTIFKNGP